MAGAFRIAEGYVEVTADRAAYDASMERLKSTRHSVKVGVELNDGGALAQLTRLTQNRATTVNVNLTGLAALTQLTEKTRDRTVKVIIKLDEGTVVSRLAALTREQSVKVKINLDERPLAALADRSYTADFLARINEPAYRRVEKQLDALAADRYVLIRASVDTRVAAAELRNLVQRQRVRIGVDVDTRVAADSLANLTRTRTARINADVRAGDARARLDALARDRRMNVDVNVRNGAMAGLTGAAGGLGGLSSSFARIAAAAAGAMPMIASLGESLIQMGPAAAIAVPAVLSLATAFAAIKIGTSGISDAFKAAFAPAEAGASAAASAAKSVASAQRALTKAVQAEKDAEVNAAAARVKAARDVRDAQQNLSNTVRDVAEANHQAAESVAAAERDLTSAQRAARQAQLDLTQARKDAAAELQDLSNQLADSQLSQRQDVLNLSDAEKQLAKDKAAGAAVSADQLAKDQLNYDQAAQALAEQQLQTQRLTDQNKAATKAGVEGSTKVTAAKQAITAANQALQDKTQALADAQTQSDRTATDGAQKLAKAQRDLADSRAAQVKAATDGARQIADAQDAVTQATDALATAQESASLKTNKLGQAMARLSPQARGFVTAVLAQRDAWRSLKLDVQDALFRGLGGTFTRLSTAVLPSLRMGLTGTAGVLNSMAKNAAGAVVNLAKTGTLRGMFAGLTNGLRPLARIPGQFVTALAQLSVAAAPAFKRLTTAVGNSADGIMKKLDKAFKSGSLTDAINKAVGIAKQFGHVLGDALGLIGNVMKAASAGGGNALGTIGALLKELRKITAMPEMQKAMTAIFAAINAIGKLLAGVVGTAVVQLLSAFAKLAPTITTIINSLGNVAPIIGGILLATNPVLGVFLLLAPVIGKLVQPISALMTAVAPLVTMLGGLASGLMMALVPIIGAIITVLATVFKAIAPVLARVIPVILKVVNAIAGPLAEAITSLVPAIGPLIGILASFDLALLPLVPSILQILPPVAQLILALTNLTVHILTPMLPLVTLVAEAFAGILAGALMVLLPVINTIVAGITVFVNAITTAVDWVVAKFQFLYDTLVGHSIIPDLVNAIIGWFTQLWTRTKQIFTGLVRDVVGLWNSLWNTVRTAWNRAWSGLQGALGNAWTWARNSVSSLRTSIASTWSGLWNGVRSTFSSIIGTVQSKIGSFASGAKTAFTNLRNSLGTIWNGIRNGFAAPIRFVVGTVYNNGIRKMWDTIAGKVGLPQLPQIKLGFAKGGIVPGSGTKDTVPAMLTPGERVLSLSQIVKLGGHRGIDAMLGKDRPTGTGGNPTNAQERKRQQPVPAFGIGGIIGNTVKDIGGAISGSVSWAKNLVVGGLQAAARKAVTAMVQPLINRIPSGGIGDLMKGLSGKVLDGILSKLGREDASALGGPAVQRGLSWAKSQAGLPYQWAGNGNPSWDCSGLMSAIESVIRGESPHRRWATGAFSGSTAPSGWVRNLVSPFMIGITNAGVGHTAGTIGGVNVESRGGAGVINGPRARGYNDPLFTDHYGFQPATKFDTGGLLARGATMAVNATNRPERVLSADHTAKLDALLGSNGSRGITIQEININGTFDFSTPSARKAAANAMVVEMKEALRNFDRGRR